MSSPLDPRISEVERLVEVAFVAMNGNLRDATAAEILSAMISMTYTAILTVEKIGGSLESFRHPLEQLYALLPKQRLDS
jgi:hypothetical protein